MGLSIGVWPHGITDEIREYLEPAARLGCLAIEEGPGWTTWTVHDGERLIGAAHVRRTVDHVVEVVLVGGEGHKEWIGPLDQRIGEWARDEGISVMRAFGRVGWAPVLTKQGWQVTERRGRLASYERRL